MKATLLTCCAAALLSGCIVYEPSIFDDLPSAGTGGREEPGGSGGEPATGGVLVGAGGSGGGGPASGGEPATGGVGAAGGSPSGGGSSTGGSCSVPEKPAPDASTKVEIDTFEVEWRKYSNSTFTGEWFSGGDGSGSDLSPSVGAWQYTDVGCSGEDLALHVTGMGYTSWGVSLDATLLSSGTFDASAHDGVTFLARSDDGDTIKVSFRDDMVVDAIDVAVPPLGSNWRRVKAAFPGGIDKSKLKTVSIVGINEPAHDFMVDDLSFFAE